MDEKKGRFSPNAITEPILSYSLQNVKQWCSDSLRNSALLTWLVSVQCQGNWVVEHSKIVNYLLKSEGIILGIGRRKDILSEVTQ